ncbi:hypothetical protein PUND_a0498 [Pseudoalteromonas undina]|uniref:Glycosyltransferase n=1 Tax=Pseudoalteromonas undina TaxID=43660 RepID=A0ABN0NK15_9GAMM|nr:glycosyltransferase [Pseudoalteromonas undina]KAF7769383.1 hypothetical protein PUND_a0498 [Pseudoalteromonas undina]
MKAKENPKKITFIINSLSGGGAEGVCVNIANGLSELGWDVTLVVLNMNSSVYHKRINKRVNFITLGVDHARYALFPIYKFIKNTQTTKLVAFSYDITILLVLIRMFSPLNYFIFTRNMNSLTQKLNDSSKGVRSRLLKFLISKLYSKADHVVNQCKAMESDLLSVFPELDKKTSVIYNAVNQKIERAAKNYNFQGVHKKEYLLCVGRLEKQKAFHNAIEVFRKISHSYPNMELKIIGVGSLEADLKKHADFLGIIDKVEFVGFTENTISYYLHARATLLTSLYEGFPNVLVESITLGTPIVAFDCSSGPSEIVIPHCNGILVENQNLDAFAQAINVLLSDNNLQDPKVIKKTSNSFSNKTILTDWERLLIKPNRICKL